MCDPVALFTPVTSLLSYKNKVCYLPLYLSNTTTVIYLYICETRQLLLPRLFVHGIIPLFSVSLWRNSFVVPLTTTQCTGLIVCQIVLLLVVHLSFTFSAISAFLILFIRCLVDWPLQRKKFCHTFLFLFCLSQMSSVSLIRYAFAFYNIWTRTDTSLDCA